MGHYSKCQPIKHREKSRGLIQDLRRHNAERAARSKTDQMINDKSLPITKETHFS